MHLLRVSSLNPFKTLTRPRPPDPCRSLLTPRSRPHKTFLTISHDRLVSLIHLLKSHGILGISAGRVLANCPAIFACPVPQVRRRVLFLEGLGFDSCAIVKAFSVSRYLSIVEMSMINLQEHVNFLEEMGLDIPSIRKMLSGYPSFFLLNIRRNVERKLKFLQNQGMERDTISYLLRSYPRVLELTEDRGLSRMLGLVQLLGLDLNSKSAVRASRVAGDGCLARFEFLKKQGFSHDQVVAMIKAQPTILTLREEHLKQKMDFFVQGLNRDLLDLVRFPAYLICSLEKRIRPRSTILMQLKERGLIKELPKLSAVLFMSDEQFSKRYGIPSQQPENYKIE